MRVALFVAVVLCSVVLATAYPSGSMCPSLPVSLQLHPSNAHPALYSILFTAVDPNHKPWAPDFVDIHYRVNNDDATNLRVLTNPAVTDDARKAKTAQVDNIVLQPGDVLRAYATYASQGVACDTSMHTFTAPEHDNDLYYNRIDDRHAYAFDAQAMLPRGAITRRPTVPALKDDINPANFECPSVPIEQDILKIEGQQNTYLLSFENQNPLRQLHFVDLHVKRASDDDWTNLRLASDMQLNMAHKVLQPGVVVKPNDALHFYYTYRVVDNDGRVVDCSTAVTSLTPDQVTHKVSMQQIASLL